jgi:hypothetical protein
MGISGTMAGVWLDRAADKGHPVRMGSPSKAGPFESDAGWRSADAMRPDEGTATARAVIAQAVAEFCEGSEKGLDLGSRFGPGTSPLAVVEAIACALEGRRRVGS